MLVREEKLGVAGEPPLVFLDGELLLPTKRSLLPPYVPLFLFEGRELRAGDEKGERVRIGSVYSPVMEPPKPSPVFIQCVMAHGGVGTGESSANDL